MEITKRRPKFVIGYNGAPATEFKGILDSYSDEIDSFFFSVPSLMDSHHKMPKSQEYNNNVIALLQKDVKCKRFLAMNNVAIRPYNESDDTFIKEKLVPFVKEYGIEGIIVADFRTATAVRHYLPDILIDSSCNSYIFTAREANMWKDYIGVNNINPPREVLRQPRLLQELADTGISLKCIVNESCLVGCPTAHRHNLYNASQSNTARMICEDTESGIVKCLCGDYANFFRSNWILPRWLDKFDDTVSLYKLSTREMNSFRLLRTLKAYINREEVENILDIIVAGTATQLVREDKELKISSKCIPDRLLTCGCSNCNRTCNICSELAKKYIGGKNE